MSNYSARILNNARSSLTAQQAVLTNIGNNIANVNTPGYTRRKVDLETSLQNGSGGGLQIGAGVRVGSLLRITDGFVDKLLRESIAQQGSAEIRSDFIGRLESLFDLSGSRPTIGSSLTSFFNALNDLSLNPANIELRTNVLERTSELVTTIRDTYNALAALQTEADQRLTEEVESVNSLAASIADLNSQIRSREAASNGTFTAADERDEREKKINLLAEKISFQRVELEDGSISLFLSNGIPLVVGATTRSLELTTSPSFAVDPLPPSLGGGVLNYIVTNFGTEASPSHVDLTTSLRQGDGTIAGLLSIRGVADPSNLTAFEADGVLVELASRIEGITRSLLTDFNDIYRGPDQNPTVAGFQPSSADLDGVSPAVFGLFDFNYSGTKDVASPGRPQDNDLDALIAAGAVRNFSSLLQVAFSDPRRFAAARDSGPGGGAAPVYSPGNGENVTALLGLRSSPQNIAAGNFSTTATYDQAYVETVTKVGNLASAADISLSVAKERVVSAENKRGEISGVNLDEEFTTMIQFQKTYQASARMIRIGDELLNEVLQFV